MKQSERIIILRFLVSCISLTCFVIGVGFLSFGLMHYLKEPVITTGIILILIGFYNKDTK